MQRVNHLPRRVISIVLTIVMVASLFSGILPGLGDAGDRLYGVID